MAIVRRAAILVREVHGRELFDARRSPSGRGLIIAAPHLGCWELLNFWLCSRTPLAIVYRPPRQAALEPLLLRARGALAVEQVRAEGAAGVRTLLQASASTAASSASCRTSSPRQGEGEFAPFFGTPALTMVLLSRLAQRTGATVLFAFAERLPRGAGSACISCRRRRHRRSRLSTACAALNRGVEMCVRLAPAQYQWHYKRYSIRPPASPASEENMPISFSPACRRAWRRVEAVSYASARRGIAHSASALPSIFHAAEYSASNATARRSSSIAAVRSPLRSAHWQAKSQQRAVARPAELRAQSGDCCLGHGRNLAKASRAKAGCATTERRKRSVRAEYMSIPSTGFAQAAERSSFCEVPIPCTSHG